MSRNDGGAGRHVLLVEEDSIVGLCLAEELEDLGYRVSGPFLRGDEALRWLAADAPDVAVLDVGLREGLRLDIARELRRRRVPFVFFSGLERPAPGFDAEFENVLWIEKPAGADEIAAAIEGVGAARRALDA